MSSTSSWLEADPLTRLHLIQERMNLQTELESLKAKTDLTELEKGFISRSQELRGAERHHPRRMAGARCPRRRTAQGGDFPRSLTLF